MRLIDIRRNLKRDPAGSLWIELHRKIGIWLTWIIMNTIPNVKANTITLSMLPLNIISAFLIYFGVAKDSVLSIVVSFIVFFLSTSLDCADGNVARIKGETSNKGILYDRIVHNISHPIMFISVGAAISYTTGLIYYSIIFSILAVLSEFAPVETALKHVKNSFIKQVMYNNTKNFDVKKHIGSKNINNQSQESVKNNASKLFVIKLIKSIFSIKSLYLTLMLDMYLLAYQEFYITFIFALIYTFAILVNDLILKNDLDEFLGFISDFQTVNDDNKL